MKGMKFFMEGKTIKVLKNVKGINISYFSPTMPKSMENEKNLLKLTKMSLEELEDYIEKLSHQEKFILKKKYGSSYNIIKCYDASILNHQQKCAEIIDKLINLKKENDYQNSLPTLTGFSLEECKRRINYAKDYQQRAMKMRFGDNFNEVLPYPNKKVKKIVEDCLKFLTMGFVIKKNEKDNRSNREKCGIVLATGLSLEECQKRVNCATDKQQMAMKTRFGDNLDELHPFPNDNNKTYYNVRNCLIFITTEPFIYEKNICKRENSLNIEVYGIVALTGLSLEECQKRLNSANDKQQMAMKMRFGENLDELHPFPKNKQGAKMVRKCIEFLKKEPFIYENKVKNILDLKNKTLTTITNLSLEECQKRLTYATIIQQRAIKVRFGANLDEIHPFPEDNNKTYFNVRNCLIFLTTEPFIYEKKKNQLEDALNVEKYGIVAITGLSLEECQRRVNSVTYCQQRAMKMRFGDNLDELHPFLKNDKKTYDNVRICLKVIMKEPFVYKKNKYQPEDALNIEKYGLVAITGLSLEECQKRVNSATIIQQRAMKVRFGDNLDELHPFPKDNSKTYGNIKNCLNFIMKEPFVYEKNEKVNLSKNIDKYGIVAITGLSLEECQRRVNSATDKQQKAMKIRFGENLDELYSFPKDDKNICNDCYNCLKFIKKEPFVYKNKNEVNEEKINLKTELMNLKLLQYKEKLVEKYYNSLQDIIDKKVLESIIIECLNSYDYKKFDLSIDGYVVFYLNNQILKYQTEKELERNILKF